MEYISYGYLSIRPPVYELVMEHKGIQYKATAPTCNEARTKIIKILIKLP